MLKKTTWPELLFTNFDLLSGSFSVASVLLSLPHFKDLVSPSCVGLNQGIQWCSSALRKNMIIRLGKIFKGFNPGRFDRHGQAGGQGTRIS